MGWVARTLLWLFVINPGIAFGAGLYEARVVFPQWLVYSSGTGYSWDAEAARRANTGLRFWVYVTTVPLTVIGLANCFAAWRAPIVLRRWWITAAGISLAERIVTLWYFVPTMVQLTNHAALPKAQAAELALHWGQLNYLRHLMVFTAWLAALKAFSIYGRNEARAS